MRRASLHATAFVLALSSHLPAQEEPPDLRELSLEDLMKTEIVSASRSVETIVEAPATVIVVTRDEIRERGYTDLSEVLADLPGMDVVRPWGATYLKNYWRGYRNTIGDPFLIMVDGVVLNHLYFNTADVLVTLPLSSVQRVEVVYGPASSVYGPNAFMGVVNVITAAAAGADGAAHRGWLAAGTDAQRLADFSSRWRSNGLELALAVRLETSELDDAHAGAYAMTRPELYADRRLWGGFVDNANIAGAFRSRRDHRAVQARVGFSGFELGFDHYALGTGYGVEYTGDRAQNDAVWTRPDTSVHVRVRRDLGRGVTSSTLVRWRSSGVSNDSTFLEGYELPARGGGTVRVADFSTWQALNTSWSAFQDFEARPGERWRLAAGFKFEEKNLQKAYDTNYGPTLAVDEIDASRYPYPLPPVEALQAQNRITTEDRGAYVQARFEPAAGRSLHLGVRHDDNSQYGDATTVRAGFVGRWGRWGAKALYGEAFQEPTPRQLYGGWTGSGSDPDLRPETSRTFELSGSWSGRAYHALVSAWRIRNDETIVNTPGGASNAGDRTVMGFDVHGQAQRAVGAANLRIWGFWSQILQADEEVAGGGEAPIGDLARRHLHVGTTMSSAEWIATLRGRWVAERDTVVTNPIRTVPSWVSVDALLTRRDVGVAGLDLTLKVTNVFDAEVLHPGVRDAEAGPGPGFFDEQGSWQGSAGFFSSLLPQPGRAALLMLRFRR